jgi:carbon storage regulator CsrA
MFVLSRGMEDSVIVDGFNSPKRMLKVTVLSIRGGKVKLGFEMNKDIPAHRAEVFERVRHNYQLEHQKGASDAPAERITPNLSLKNTFRR